MRTHDAANTANTANAANTVKLLLLVVAALITYGSLFPFELRRDPVDADDYLRVAGSWFDSSSRGNVLGNIALCVPYGFLGMFAFGGRKSRRFALMFVTGFVLAVAIQFVQLYFATRVPGLSDALLNAVGLVLGGLVAARWPERLSLERGVGAVGREMRVAIVLIGLWIIARLMPLVPSIDLQSFKDSLKPLLLTPRFVWVSVLGGCVGWLVVAHLWRGAGARVWKERHLPWLMAGVFAGEVLVVSNVVTLSSVAGAVAALGLWWAGLRRMRPKARAGLLALLLGSLMILRGWSPFEFRDPPAQFAWIPFSDALRGSMLVNATAWVEKTFLFGSLLWLLRQIGVGARTAAALTVLLALVVEIGQRWFLHHSPALTDPFLALLMAVFLAAWAGGGPPRRESRPSRIGTPRS